MSDQTAVIENDVGVILADDLTGACDSAVRILGAGRRVAVSLDHHLDSFNGYNYMAVNTNTRSSDEALSKARIISAVNNIRSLNGTVRYKKIDSMLRGNITAELEALFETLPIDAVLIAPGYPENDRIVENGVLYAGNTQDAIALVLQLPRPCGILSAKLLEQGAEYTAVQMEKLYREGVRYFIGDSVNSSDLEVLAESLRKTSLNILPAGSGGLVRYIFNEKTTGTETPAMPVGDDPRILYVIGSGNPVTVRQVKEYLQHTGARTEAVDTVYPAKPDPKFPLLVSTRQVLEGKPVCKKTVGNNISNHAIESGLSEIAGRYYHKGVRKMFLTGGDTAYEVLKTIGFSEIEILGESEPGVVIAIARGKGLDDLCIVTKSGGFGSPEALIRVEKLLNGSEGEPHV